MSEQAVFRLPFVAKHPEEAASGRFCRYGDEENTGMLAW